MCYFPNRTDILNLLIYQVYTRSETLPDPAAAIQLPTDRKVRVYADMAQVRTFLTDGRFVIVDQEETADIVWTKSSIRDFRYMHLLQPFGFLLIAIYVTILINFI